MSPRPDRLAAEIILFLVAVFWGTSFSLVKEAMEQTTPANFLALRFAISCLALLPALAWKARDFSPRVVWPSLSCGALLFGAFLTQVMGLKLTSASRSGFITGLNVILVPILSLIVLRKSPGRAAFVGALTAFAGLYLLTSMDQTQSGPFNLGDALTLACAFLCAGHILVLGRYAQGADAFWLTFGQLFVVCLGGLAWAAFSGELNFSLPLNIYLVATYLALICTLGAYLGQTWAQARTTPTRTAVIFTLEPAAAAAFAAFWLGERLGPLGLAGAGLILAGILLSELKPKALR